MPVIPMPMLVPERALHSLRHLARHLLAHRAVRRERVLPHAELRHLHLVRIRNDAAGVHVARSCDLREARAEQPARAALGRRNAAARAHGTSRARARRGRRLPRRTRWARPRRAASPRRGPAQLRGIGGGMSARREAEVHALPRREETRAASRPLRAPSSPSRSASADSPMPVVRSVRETTIDAALADALAHAAAATVSHGHPAHLARHAGEHRDPASLRVVEPEAGRGAVIVVEHARARGHHRLHEFVCRHLRGVELPETFLNLRDNRSSRTSSRPNSFAMAGRVRSSAVGPSPPVVMTAPVRSIASAHGRRDAIRVVAHGAAMHDLDADLRERAREEGGVGVDGEAEQQLVADGEQLYLHDESRVTSIGRIPALTIGYGHKRDENGHERRRLCFAVSVCVRLCPFYPYPIVSACVSGASRLAADRRGKWALLPAAAPLAAADRAAASRA